jgi:hypothetical protein
MRTFSPRLTLTRRLAVSTLLPVTLASISVPENPAVVVVGSAVEVGPALVVVVVLATVVVAPAAPPPSSPPHPASAPPEINRPARSQRQRAIRPPRLQSLVRRTK